MVKSDEFIDKRGRKLEVICGENGWIVKFDGGSHYVENDDGFDQNYKAVSKHIKEIFGEVEDVCA